MMMFHSQLPELHHFPATEALYSVLFLDHDDEKQAICKVLDPTTRNTRKIFPLSSVCSSSAGAAARVKRPRSFDISDIKEAALNIERSLEFPLINWSFEEEKHHDSAVYDGKWWMHSPSSAAKRRKCRGVVRSISTCDLSEMFAANLD
jgi:hypothetical protein